MSDIREVELSTPITPEESADLQPGDAVFLNGLVFTGREKVYRQMFEQGDRPDLDIAGQCNVNFHCSPAVSETDPGRYRIPSVTATASFRFAGYIERVIRELGVRAVIGKAGMAPAVYQKAFRPHGAIYLTTVGYGLGALYGRGIRAVKTVFWKEKLGLAQAMWVLEVERFGPFLVDYAGGDTSLFEQENQAVNPRLLRAYDGLAEPILKRIGETTRPEDEIV
jgi:L(+)-tartrate dehydratase beta subunit